MNRTTCGAARLLLLALLPASALAADVLTSRNNNARTGSTDTPGLDASVFQSGAWRKLADLPVNGRVYAQPLYVERLDVPAGRALRDVVYVVTARNQVTAFDANTLSPTPLWGPTKLGQNDLSRVEPVDELPCNFMSPDGLGNQATPVIDRARGRMYVPFRVNVSLKENDLKGAREMLAAIDIRTGALVKPPAQITTAGFDPVWHRNRVSLLLHNNMVYVAYGSRCEDIPQYKGQSTIFHGWIFAFDADTLDMRGAFQLTPPDIDGGGIWQASSGLAADASSIYVMTGNRRPDVDGKPRAQETYADSIVRIIPRIEYTGWLSNRKPIVTFQVADYFTPYRRIWMDQIDLDLGSAGPILIPNTPYLIGGGKQGLLYVVDRNNMGKLDTVRAWNDANLGAIKFDSVSFDFKENPAADPQVKKVRVGFNQFIPEYPAYLAPPGGAIAAAKQLDDQLDVFTVGRDGALYVTWERGDGPWSDGHTVAGYNPRPYPARITPPSLVPRNARVVAAKQSDNQLDAFWVGNDGAIWVTWVTGDGQWTDGFTPTAQPARITPQHFAKPGACLAVAKQTNDQLDVFVIRDDGAVWVTWVTGLGHWSDGSPGQSSPARITPTGVAPSGGCLAAAKQTDHQLDVFYVHNDGAIYVTWVVDVGIWTDGLGNHGHPARITGTQLAPPGAPLVAAKETGNKLDVFVAGKDDAVWVTRVIGTGIWTDGGPGHGSPKRITPTNTVLAGSGITVSEQVANQLDVLFVDKQGTMRVAWLIGPDTWSDGVGTHPAPAATTPKGLFPGGAQLVAMKQNANRLDAFAVSHDGAIRMTWVDGVGHWADSDRPPNTPAMLSRALWMHDWVAWPHIHGTPVFARFPDQSALLYVWPEKDHLKSFPWTGTQLNEAGKKLAVDLHGGLSLAPDGMPGGMLSVTVDPTKRRAGVLFAALTRNDQTDGPGVLRAFDAVTLREVWNNEGENYAFSKFVPPTIAGGKVFLPTSSNKIIVYGR